MANVDIVIRTIDQAKAGFTSVTNNLKGVGDTADIAAKKAAILGTVVAATTALIRDSYSAYSELSESIRDLSLVSGESAENTSRFIQVLDDFQITADDATSAAKKLKDNGLSPTIETLAMLSDQFRGIQDPAERMDFVYDKLGKSGAKWVNVLNQGSEALLANADAINKNLILSDFEIKMYEAGRLAIDEKRDAVEAFKVELGQSVGNVLAYAKAMERAREIQADSAKAVRGGGGALIDYNTAVKMAIAEQLKAADAAVEFNYNLEEQERAAKLAEEALKSLSDSNKNFLSTLETMQGESESFAEKYAEINNDMSLSDDERKAKLQELTAEHELSNRKIILGLLERKLTQDGILDDRELMWLLEKGKAWGIYSQTVIDETQKAIDEANLLAETLNGLPKEGSFTYTINTVGGGDIGVIAQSVSGGNYTRRARGGDVWAGQTYMVGENGAELFTAPSNGQIIPRERMGTQQQQSNTDAMRQFADMIVAAIYATRQDPRELARIIKENALQVVK